MRNKPSVISLDSTTGLDPRTVSILNDNFRSLMTSVPSDDYIVDMLAYYLGDYDIEDGHVVIPTGNKLLDAVASFVEDLMDNPRE